MASDIFTRAKAYRKKHPRMAWSDCVKACAGKKKPAAKKAAVKKAAPKKRAAAVTGTRHKKAATKRAAPAKTSATRKIKVKIRPKKNGGGSITIGAISLNKVKSELDHQASLNKALARHSELLKAKGLKPAEKAAIRRDIAKYKHGISSSKKHVSALKRNI